MSGPLTDRLRDALAPALEKLGYELIQVEQVATRRPVLRLYIDRLGADAGGVTLDALRDIAAGEEAARRETRHLVLAALLSLPLALPGVHLHLYGKTEARRARKMGHLTVTADSGRLDRED